MSKRTSEAPRQTISGRRLFAVLVLAGAAAAAGVYWPEQEVDETPKTLLMGWRPVFTQSGSGSVQTESFYIETGQWRIKWAATTPTEPDGTNNTFRVTAHSAVSGRALAEAVNHQGAGDGVAYLAEEPRPFFLRIEADGLGWSVEVEEGISGARQESP